MNHQDTKRGRGTFNRQDAKKKRSVPPLPGSREAVKGGCTCPVMDNAERPAHLRVYNADCPMHGSGLVGALLEAVRGKDPYAPHPNCRCSLPPAAPPRSILLEAHELIHGDRAAAYGPVGENWGRTVAIFKAVTGKEMTVQEALIFMVAVKLAREYHQPKRDNVRDACGYLALYDQVAGQGAGA